MSDSKSGLLAKLASSINAQGEIAGIDSAAVQGIVDVSVNSLVNAAPDTLNTLNELAAALGDDANFATTVTNNLAQKADASTLSSVAISGSFNDLSDKPAASSSLNTVTLLQQGALEVTTGEARWYAPANISISKVVARIASEADSVVTIVVKKNSYTVSTLNIAGGNLESIDTSNVVMNEGDYLTVDITAVGSTVTGNNLNVQFVYSII